ncbi:MAG TPA: hypothetical protein VN722_13320 [Hanamia sp.]|nr:hypothetical protein [Hanamia sp.]
MKQFLLLLTLVCLTTIKGFSQEDPIPEGYKLKISQNIIYVYRNVNDKPDLTVRNRWSNRYWFKVDNTSEGKYEDPITKEKYMRITIPSNSRFDDAKNEWTNETGYNIMVNWKKEEFIDGSDFNTWLWIRQVGFDALKVDYYRNIKGSFILSGLTAPFKFRPNVGTQLNSVVNGDINLGSFIGFRFAKGVNLGISVGGHFGLSSISLNASNNTGITGNSTETIQGFTYGYGVVIEVKKQFQIGILGGFDYGLGNLAKTYLYQNKNWFSFSLNYKFFDFGKKDSDTNKKEADKAKK